jgi:hypothetical protein
VSGLWTPLSEGPHEAFVDRLHRLISQFAEERGVKAPLVQLELSDGARFIIERITPEPGFGMVTVVVHPSRDTEAPDALVVPIGSILRIELRAAPDDDVSRFGFALPGALGQYEVAAARATATPRLSRPGLDGDLEVECNGRTRPVSESTRRGDRHPR